jgi:hypothetical protein
MTDISFHGNIWMRSPRIWLSSFASTVRRLELTRVYTKSKAVKDLVFPELETLEFHWCPPRLLKGAQFPSLKYYSESIELGWEEGDYCTTALAVVRAHMDQLRIIVLRGEYSHQFHRLCGPGPLLNIDQVIASIRSAKRKGSLRSAFIEGSFALSSAQTEPWLRFLGPMDFDDVEGRSKARMSILKEVDPECRFRETRSNGIAYLGRIGKLKSSLLDEFSRD